MARMTKRGWIFWTSSSLELDLLGNAGAERALGELPGRVDA